MRFDAFQREQALNHIVEQLAEGRSLRLLDIGGFPGASHRILENHRCTIVDQIEGRCDRYVFGDGARLPFSDNAFDGAFCLDVLEHVPPSARGSFLAEMVRVSKDWIAVIGPFDTPGVEEAEISVDEAWRQFTGKPNPWLVEHRENGLPNEAETREALREQGLVPHTVPIGSLATWAFLMQMDALLETLPDSLALAEALDAFYAQAGHSFDSAAHTYRRAIVAGVGSPIANPERLALSSPKDSDAVALPAATFQVVRALAEWAGSVKADTPEAEAAYVRKLEETISHLEREIGDLKNRQPSEPKGFLGKLMGR